MLIKYYIVLLLVTALTVVNANGIIINIVFNNIFKLFIYHFYIYIHTYKFIKYIFFSKNIFIIYHNN